MPRTLLTSCRKAVQAVAQDLDGGLPPGRKLVLLMHLAMCGACRQYVRQVRGIERLLRLRLRAPAALNDAERERLIQRLRDR